MIKRMKFFALAISVFILITGCTAPTQTPPTSTVPPTVAATITVEPLFPSGVLVYFSENELFKYDLKKQAATTFTTASEFLKTPATGQYLASAPDGKILLFSGYDPLFGCSTFRPVPICAPTGPNGFFTLDLSNQSAALIRPYTISNLSLSPKGDQFSFTVLEFETTDYQVHLKLSPIGGGEPTVLTTGHVVDTFPSWSPDGQWIAFLRTPSPDPKAPECTPEPVEFDTCQNPRPTVYIIHPDGTGLQKLTEDIRLIRSPYNQPAWSADSQTLAVVSGSPSAQVTLINIADGSQQKIAAFSPTSAAPVWSPRDPLLAFSASGQEHEQIILYNYIDQTTQILANGSMPVWSPDGQWLAILQQNSNNKRGLVLVNIISRDLIDLHTPPVNTQPLWMK